MIQSFFTLAKNDDPQILLDECSHKLKEIKSFTPNDVKTSSEDDFEKEDFEKNSD